MQMGSGVMRIQVRNHETEESNCFYLIRTDGSVDDFSVFKCINRLFPAYGESRNFPVSGHAWSACRTPALPLSRHEMRVLLRSKDISDLTKRQSAQSACNRLMGLLVQPPLTFPPGLEVSCLWHVLQNLEAALFIY
jgi:hypothetical protein